MSCSISAAVPAERRSIAAGRLGALGHQVHRRSQTQRDVLGITPGLACPAVDHGDLLGVLGWMELGRGAVADGMPAVRQLSGPAQRNVRVAADPDRYAGLLRGLREHTDLRHSIVRAGPLHRFPCPAFPHEAEILVCDPAALGEGRGVQGFELLAEPTDARPEDDASPRHRIERGEHLGRHDRVAVRDDEHARADPDARCRARQEAHQRQRLHVPLAPVASRPAGDRVGILRVVREGNDDVIGHEDRCVAQRVRLFGELHEHVGLGERSTTRQCEAEAHGRILLVARLPVKGARCYARVVMREENR